MISRDLTPVEQREALDHREMINALESIMKSAAGRSVLKYMLKEFAVGVLPEPFESGLELHEKLGFLRAGQSFFKICCEANYSVAAEMLATLEKERYHERYIEKYGDENSKS